MVLVDGQPVFYLGSSQRRLISFAEVDDEQRLQALRVGVVEGTRRARRLSVRIEQVDGQPAKGSPLAALFQQAGFVAEQQAVSLEISP